MLKLSQEARHTSPLKPRRCQGSQMVWRCSGSDPHLRIIDDISNWWSGLSSMILMISFNLQNEWSIRLQWHHVVESPSDLMYLVWVYRWFIRVSMPLQSIWFVDPVLWTLHSHLPNRQSQTTTQGWPGHCMPLRSLLCHRPSCRPRLADSVKAFRQHWDW